MYSERYIGERIKERRKELGLTQSELAVKINPWLTTEAAPHTQIAKWERGKATPETDTLIRLCNALDCDMDYILGRIDAPHRSTYDVAEQTGLSKDAAETLKLMKKENASEVLSILSDLISDIQFWYALKNIRNAKKDSLSEADGPMSDTAQRAKLVLAVENKYRDYPGDTVISSEERRDMNLYHASQKFSECAARIAGGRKNKTASRRKR